jgi:hypothetical protein
MMDKAYILEHGILELYLLGELTAEEQLQVEAALKTDAELKSLFNTLETNFETLAFENAINPPKSAKDVLMQRVKMIQPKVVQLPKASPLKLYLTIAASIAVFLTLGSIWVFTQLNNTKKELKIANEQNELLIKDINGLTNNLEYKNKYFDIINSPDTEQYILLGNALVPNAKVVSYVNNTEKQVIINTKNLPKLDEKHDYQMWADVNGVMIDMGVINKEENLLAMNYIDNAESLNITIEPNGGSDHPNVSKLVTNVYLK